MSGPEPVSSVVNLDGEEGGNKTLGVLWNPKRDVIGFASKEVTIDRLIKRTVLSNISKLYDPLCLASAVTIKVRIALQNVCKAKQFDWDDPLSEDMSETWKKLLKKIESLRFVESRDVFNRKKCLVSQSCTSSQTRVKQPMVPWRI